MKKIPVAILGATGAVGQKFILLLSTHPQFEIAELVASEKSAGKMYHEAVSWLQSLPIPHGLRNMIIKSTKEKLDSPLLFSGLTSAVAGPIESAFAEKGHIVMSNAQNHRMDASVPLVIPEINPDHFALLKAQQHRGKIITNSNCVTMFLAMVLAPLHRNFGVKEVQLTTLQAVSGAGYPGVASLDILGNVIPYIKSEEEKVESEARKILGTLKENRIQLAPITISAQCYRVPVRDGHTSAVSIRFKDVPSLQALEESLREFRGYPQEAALHSAPQQPIHICKEDTRPQPLLDIDRERGMTAVVGRIRPCTISDYKMTIVGHNTIRGAAGASILNAEAYLQLGYAFP